jgi:hypothetical protein
VGCLRTPQLEVKCLEIIMCDNNEKKKLFDSYRDEILRRELSNSESYDKAILSLSSAGLAITLTLLQSIIKIETATSIELLFSTWICFGLSIIFTISSIMVSQKALSRQLYIAEDYYLNEIENAYDAKNVWANYTIYTIRASAICFVTAIICVIWFSISNLNNIHHGATNMPPKSANTDTKNTATSSIAQDGALVPKMQKAETSAAKTTQPSDNSQKKK